MLAITADTLIFCIRKAHSLCTNYILSFSNFYYYYCCIEIKFLFPLYIFNEITFSDVSHVYKNIRLFARSIK